MERISITVCPNLNWVRRAAVGHRYIVFQERKNLRMSKGDYRAIWMFDGGRIYIRCPYCTTIADITSRPISHRGFVDEPMIYFDTHRCVKCARCAQNIFVKLANWTKKRARKHANYASYE